jgi:hypothetical protein
LTLTLNPPPLVDITAPADGESVLEGDTVPVSATATDDGSVASVTFAVDGVEQAAFTAAPYSFDFPIPTGGAASFLLEVTAVDNYGGRTTASRTVPVTTDPMTTVTGVVQDKAGAIVPGASIYITKGGITGSTSFDGTFTIPEVPTLLGAVTARASALVGGRTVYTRSGPLVPIPSGVVSAGTLTLKGLPFYSGEKFAALAGQTGMVEADMDQDGIPDVVTVNAAGGVSVYFGYGDGRLEARMLLTAAGAGARGVAVDDFNNDTRPDIALSLQDSHNVAVFLAEANGTFTARQDYPVGTAPGAVVSADLNNDGFKDILTANRTSNDVSVLMGLGEGLFAAEQRVGVGLQPVGLAAARLDADAALDLVTANGGSRDVSVLLGTGTGTFAAQTLLTTAEGLIGVGVADINNDAVLDIVSVSDLPAAAAGEINIFIGAGSGAFSPALVRAVTADPAVYRLADFNGDNRADVLLGHAAPSGEITVLLNDGAGGFGPEQDFTMTAADPLDALKKPFPVFDLLAADLNNDGARDLTALVDQAFTDGAPEQTLQVVLGTPAEIFVTARTAAVGPQPVSGSTADFNNDGSADIVTANQGSDDLSLLMGEGLGALAAEVRIALGFTPSTAVAGEFSGDSLADIVVTAPSGAVILVGLGDGTFSPAALYTGSALETSAADIDGDGVTDAVTANYTANDVTVRLGRGDGTFGPPLRFAVGSGPRDVVVVDLNNDTRQDIVSVNEDGTVSILTRQ